MGFPPAMARGISHQRIQPGESVHLPNTEAAEILPPVEIARADQQAADMARSPTGQVVDILSGLLPKGAAVAVCWRDWALGCGRAHWLGFREGLLMRSAFASQTCVLGEQEPLPESGPVVVLPPVGGG